MKNNKSIKSRKILIYFVSIILAIILINLDGVYIYINKTLDKVENIEVNTDNIGLNNEIKEEFKK